MLSGTMHFTCIVNLRRVLLSITQAPKKEKALNSRKRAAGELGSPGAHTLVKQEFSWGKKEKAVAEPKQTCT